MRDIRMVELSQDLPLDSEPRLNGAGHRAAKDYFDGHLLFEFSVGSFGKEYLPHAADTQSAQHTIRPYAVSFHHQSMRPGAGEPQTAAALAAECCLRV
jgi:hypothetical protein